MVNNIIYDSNQVSTLSKKGVSIREYKQRLENYVGELSHDISVFKNTPLLSTNHQLESYQELTKLLNKALQQIVSNFNKDIRIQQIYQLDVELVSILKLADSFPYEVGMYRPDIIFDDKGQAKICEIGCRYPINGWMLSYYITQVLKELHTLENDWSPVSFQLDFISEIFKNFNIDKNIFYLHNKEKGTEAYLLFEELNKRGFSIQDVAPSQLSFVNDQLEYKGEQTSQFILELDREELKTIDKKVLKAIVKSERCISDIRSIILVHDKRVLSVLYNEEIMLDYMTCKEYRFLKQFLIPSFILDTSKKREEFSKSAENWVLKRSSGGRGIDMYVKAECSKELWENTIQNEWKNYMIQQFVDQKKIQITEHNTTNKLNIVGMLLSYNEQTFGPGIYRGSTKSIINVHSGASIFPSAIKK
ncbi:hypothetical protein ACSIGC_00945 [Tenacibaculum sp. ZS6-P6]|uniref:hypothetical protein n=1 Tax=Tenacibaculum sp. ZS6-P6 TaxID=3447503 RepID=UPI003F9BB25C